MASRLLSSVVITSLFTSLARTAPYLARTIFNSSCPSRCARRSGIRPVKLRSGAPATRLVWARVEDCQPARPPPVANSRTKWIPTSKLAATMIRPATTIMTVQIFPPTERSFPGSRGAAEEPGPRPVSPCGSKRGTVADGDSSSLPSVRQLRDAATRSIGRVSDKGVGTRAPMAAWRPGGNAGAVLGGSTENDSDIVGGGS